MVGWNMYKSNFISDIFNCACMIRPYFFFLSKIWRCHYVPWPRFPQRHENFCNSRTFKADIGLLIFAWIFRTFWYKIGVLGAKWGRSGAMLTPNKLTVTFWSSYFCANFDENWSRNVTVMGTQIHWQTHGQTQTGFTICPMLYAIAMRQIMTYL